VTLRTWIDKLLGRRPPAEEPPSEPAEPFTFPSQRPFTEEEQEQRDKEDAPDDSELPPIRPDYLNP
jgi:hypothetical protein